MDSTVLDNSMGHEEVITSHILQNLGKPKHLIKIGVNKISNNSYRVNVQVDKSHGTSILPEPYIPYSYFIVMNNNQISHVYPEITKRY